MHLGEVIKKYRKERDMTIQEFAAKADLTKGYVSMIERNYNPRNGGQIVPSIRTYNKVAIAMDMTIDELMQLVDSDSMVSLAVTSKDEQIYAHYNALAQLLDLEVNDIAKAIAFAIEMKK